MGVAESMEGVCNVGKVVELGAFADARADFPLRLEWRRAHVLSDIGCGGAHVIDDEEPVAFSQVGLRDEVSDVLWIREFYGLQACAPLPTATAAAAATPGPQAVAASSPNPRHEFKGLVFYQDYEDRMKPVVAAPHESTRVSLAELTGATTAAE
ncbi:hypothetical protein H9P43_008701 [Blastocladiella emersonii ATCC 22665]|nr:hypothetical protein H9P43_008701 [Blastocladiella emersonii ATCC 22665]